MMLDHLGKEGGGDGGIRTLDRALQPYNGLANRRLQPLGHISATARYARHGGEPQAPDCECLIPAPDLAGRGRRAARGYALVPPPASHSPPALTICAAQ